MNEEKFWKIIESSWADSPEIYALRTKALENNEEKLLEELSGKLENEIFENYNERIKSLEKYDFTNFIHILEEKLYIIDREEIQEYTDGSDDGFLYCRCFIVGMGEKYYTLVDKNPSKATMDIEAESFGFSAYTVYEKKFGEEFERNSIHCIESCSNTDSWTS
ncbi:MAG: DUF4240 domain-containing protein [Acidobacteriota bacterium]|jgi:hypothetical protein|nr:DUF4240 domain-containing protein [Acidobacteriota bacterium]